MLRPSITFEKSWRQTERHNGKSQQGNIRFRNIRQSKHCSTSWTQYILSSQAVYCTYCRNQQSAQLTNELSITIAASLYLHSHRRVIIIITFMLNTSSPGVNLSITMGDIPSPCKLSSLRPDPEQLGHQTLAMRWQHRMHAVYRCGLLLQISHVAWSVCLSVLVSGHTGASCKNGWTGRDAVWGGGDSCGSKQQLLLDGGKIGRIHSHPQRVRSRRCDLFPNYFDTCSVKKTMYLLIDHIRAKWNLMLNIDGISQWEYSQVKYWGCVPLIPRSWCLWPQGCITPYFLRTVWQATLRHFNVRINIRRESGFISEPGTDEQPISLQILSFCSRADTSMQTAIRVREFYYGASTFDRRLLYASFIGRRRLSFQ